MTSGRADSVVARLAAGAIAPGAVALVIACAAAWIALLTPVSAAAQGAALLPPTDPAHAHLRMLEAAGVVARGLQGVGPLSEARVAWVVRDARALLAASLELPQSRRADLLAAVQALEARFGSGAAGGLVELEGSVGESPGRGVPDIPLGGLDVVVNPLIGGSGGRSLGDRAGVAVAARAGVGLGSRAALVLGGRADASRYSGDAPGRRGGVLELALVRAVAGPVALEVGRSPLRSGLAGTFGLVLAPSLPSLDLVRISADRPIAVPVLGDLDFQLFAADLGPAQSYPHASLFGWVLGSRPVEGTRFELALLSKQGGEGAPEAPFLDRLEDFAWIGSWWSPRADNLSDKYASLGIRTRLAAVELLAEAALTDMDRALPRHTLVESAAYRLGVALPALGPAGRHALRVEGVTAGPHMYRHEVFRTGAAVEGYAQGSDVGPDGRAILVAHAFTAPASGWRTEVSLAVEERSADAWSRSPLEADALVLLEDRAEEVRARLAATLTRDFLEARMGARVTLGGERIRNFAFQAGAHRWSWTARVGLWRAF
ncbi:MAG TPA: capsule assembly Wzi family protein [Longimicrobiales bacterium]|nr:capsule assembly Wzi family protein [Longimicrobiales bacterium]